MANSVTIDKPVFTSLCLLLKRFVRIIHMLNDNYVLPFLTERVQLKPALIKVDADDFIRQFLFLCSVCHTQAKTISLPNKI